MFSRLVGERYHRFSHQILRCQIVSISSKYILKLRFISNQVVRVIMRLFFGWQVKLIVFSLLLNSVHSYEVLKESSKNVIHRGIHKRGLFYPVLLYPYNACSGILVAIAVPLTGLPGRNVFLSYNFEANYNMPNQASDSMPGEINRFPGLNPQPAETSLPDNEFAQRSFEKLRQISNGTKTSENTTAAIETTATVLNATESSSARYSIDDSLIISRTSVYRLLESRINS